MKDTNIERERHREREGSIYGGIYLSVPLVNVAVSRGNTEHVLKVVLPLLVLLIGGKALKKNRQIKFDESIFFTNVKGRMMLETNDTLMINDEFFT